jgi:hypothetical protein
MLKKLYVTLEKLEMFEEFKKFKQENPDYYLTSGFFMIEDKNKLDSTWQVDFFTPSSHKITSFIIDGDKLEIKPNQDVFQKDKGVLKELKVEDIKVDFKDILEKVEILNKEKYHESPNKIIVLLQNIDVITWNITYLTQSFKVWNIKYNAENGDLISEKIESILSFKSQ